MRTTLQELDGEVVVATALFERTGVYKSRWGGGSTYLLSDVRDAETGQLLTTHLWFKTGKWATGMKPGDRIEFKATVKPYLKGLYGAREVDFRLTRPRNMRIISSPAE